MDKHLTPETTQGMLELTQNSIYLMGACFVLGSLFTLFLLLVLDFVRNSNASREEKNNQ